MNLGTFVEGISMLNLCSSMDTVESQLEAAIILCRLCLKALCRFLESLSLSSEAAVDSFTCKGCKNPSGS